MKLIRFIQKIWNLVKKQDPIKYAVGLGVVVGNNCKFIGSPNWGSEPWLITIGNHVEISFDVTFLTHDGSTWVFRNEARYKNVIRLKLMTTDLLIVEVQYFQVLKLERILLLLLEVL